jgi:hypothetical protein
MWFWQIVLAQGHISRGIQVLHKVLLGPAIPYHSMPCGWSPLKQPYGQFRGGYLQGRWPVAVLLPLWIPYAVPLCFGIWLHVTSLCDLGMWPICFQKEPMSQMVLDFKGKPWSLPIPNKWGYCVASRLFLIIFFKSNFWYFDFKWPPFLNSLS